MSQNRIHYLSLASVIAAFAMVMLHTNGCFWQFSTERFWATANIIESVMYFAVPVFYMITGATLMDYRERYSTIEYFKKRILKAFIPYLVWSFLGYLWMGEEIQIYWFFIPLFRIYLLIPLVSYIKKENRKRVFIPLSIVLFLIDFLICTSEFVQEYHRTEIDKMCLYLSFVIVGYLIHKHDMSSKWRRVIYVLGIIGLMVHLIGTYVLSIEVGYVSQYWKGYGNIPCIVYSIAIFVFIKQIGQKIKNEKFVRGIEFLSQYTFAIYLLHWYVIDQIVQMFSIDTRSIIYRVGMPLVLFVVCIAITWCIRKIPVLRRLLP